MLHGNVLLHDQWNTDDLVLDYQLLPGTPWRSAVAGLRPEVVHVCAADHLPRHLGAAGRVRLRVGRRRQARKRWAGRCWQS